MAYIECHYFSNVLGNNVDISVIVPTPEGNEQITDKKMTRYNYEEGMKVVYLLHGAYGNHSSWVRFSNIERYLQERNMVGVMVSSGNNFYQDMYKGLKYHKYITEELPAMMQALFPVSKKREDTFVAGFSMGGYGAWYMGLSRPDVYSKAASLSGALDLAGLLEGINNGAVDGPFPLDAIWEDPTKIEGSDSDLFALYKKDKENGLVPDLYQGCGKDDFLFAMNNDVNKRFQEMGAEVTYRVGEGMHNWDYWDSQLRDMLDWFLEK